MGPLTTTPMIHTPTQTGAKLPLDAGGEEISALVSQLIGWPAFFKVIDAHSIVDSVRTSRVSSSDTKCGAGGEGRGTGGQTGHIHSRGPASFPGLTGFETLKPVKTI